MVAALDVEASGVSMAVDGGVVGEAVFLNDGEGAAPVQEIVLDGFAVDMITNAAFSVACRARSRPLGRREWTAWLDRGL